MYSVIKNKFIYFQQHRFIRSVAFLQMASILGNFIQALAGVFIARLLQPELFGIYTIAFSLAGLFFISGIQDTLTVILGQTYNKNDREGTINALTFFLKFTIVFSFITLVLALFLPEIAKYFYHNSNIGIYAGLAVCAAIFSTTAFTMSMMLLQVTGNIKIMSMLTVIDQVIRFSASLVLVFLGYGVFGAILGHLVGAMIIFILAVTIWSYQTKRYTIFPSWRELFIKIRTKSNNSNSHLRFTLWAALDKNIASLFGILPILIVGVFLSHSEVTYFRLALGYIGLALTLLVPITTLLNSELSKMRIQNPENMARNFVRISLYSVVVSTVLTLGAIITAPIVFRILYGESFLPSIRYVAYFLIYGSLFGLGVGLGPMWRTLNKLRVSILINLIILGVCIPLGLLLIKKFEITGAISMVTIMYVLAHFTSFIYLATHLRRTKVSRE